MNNTLNDDVRDYLETDQIPEPMQESSNEIQEDGAIMKDEEPENNSTNSTQLQQPAMKQPAMIKIENELVSDTEQKSPTSTASEKDDNNLQDKVQSTASSTQEKVGLLNDQTKTFKAISKKLKRMMKKMINFENANLEKEKKRYEPTNPQDLSKDFCTPSKGRRLGLKTKASLEGNYTKFNILETINREDLAPCIGLTVFIVILIF